MNADHSSFTSAVQLGIRQDRRIAEIGSALPRNADLNRLRGALLVHMRSVSGPLFSPGCSHLILTVHSYRDLLNLTQPVR